ncbi:hypothetical protein A3462_05415 [Enterobacter bugandensis]|nr:hypothetical protein A3462_05415 [Enterobacter bugandensis]
MSRFIQGNCVHIMSGFPDNAVDFIVGEESFFLDEYQTPDFDQCRASQRLSACLRYVRVVSK